jgi:hypothetical protein
MKDRRSSPFRRTIAGGAWGLVAGSALGAGMLALAGVAVAHRLASRVDGDPGALIEAAHMPPLLTLGSDPVELRYDIYCAAPGNDPESGAPCSASGIVYARAGRSGAFQAIPMKLDPGAAEGRYVATLPPNIGSSPTGFSYYAVVRNDGSGAEATIPAGGATAAQSSLPLRQPVGVALGAHEFGAVRKADARVASAAWGDGPAQAGLEGGPQTTPIGATGFDVDASGVVSVLDEAHRRVLRFVRGAKQPQAIPLAINGTLADMSIAQDRTIYVLETAGQAAAQTPTLRSFAPDGKSKGSWHTAERTVAAVRIGPDGPVTLDYPSTQWMPAAQGGDALDRTAQEAQGRAGRPLPGGGQVIVLRVGNELRGAIVGPTGVRQSWRITSQTPLAEVQLAEPFGKGLVIVARVYTDRRDEFVALVLDESGIVRQFSLDPAEWAETAPVSRFRLVGSSLYQLGSTPAGMFVDRFDLGVSS